MHIGTPAASQADHQSARQNAVICAPQLKIGAHISHSGAQPIPNSKGVAGRRADSGVL